MPKSSLDWLGVISLWIGAIVLALKSADAPLLPEAPPILAANFWNLVPLLLVSLALLVFIYRQMKPVESERPVLPVEPGEFSDPPRDLQKDPLATLQKARSNAVIASKQGTMRTRLRACHTIDAAMITIKKEFGIEPLSFNDPTTDATAQVWLEYYVRYIDCFYPLLREGHLIEARNKAIAFREPLENLRPPSSSEPA